MAYELRRVDGRRPRRARRHARTAKASPTCGRSRRSSCGPRTRNGSTSWSTQVEVERVPTLDPDTEQVVYEISGWTEEQRADLEAILLAEAVPHGFDENGDLVVLEADEERVEPILDRVDMEDVSDRRRGGGRR